MTGKTSLKNYIWKKRWLYLMCIPGLVYLIVFHYVPMYGIMMAFQNFSFKKGIFGSPFNDFANFKELFGSQIFYRVLRNSLFLSVTRLIFSFPVPIILALLINEIRSKVFKRTAQTLMYLPHFLSWVVLGGIVVNMLSMTDGLVNDLIAASGGEKINFLGSVDWFRTVIIGSHIWKEAGWGTIIYLSALTSINPEYYEAAKVDGANRFQQTLYITLPGISGTIVIMLILAIGGLMNNGFEQIFLFKNNLNQSVAEVFETYVYQVGIAGGRYSYSTAVGLFKNVVGAVLVFSSNLIAQKLGQPSFYS
ncbi:MAG: sugar ABC transporter permease [Clostridia bacterium]|nr:sugar ABC transporter permease [Clostridia bacterium]